MPQTPDAEHFHMIAKRCIAGSVVPFLGAGVNLCGRPVAQGWEWGSYLPSGAELAEHLAREMDYPYPDSSKDLLRVSQYVDVQLGSGPLYEALHQVFDADYRLTSVHQVLASLPGYVRARRTPGPKYFPLIVTTNYDDALERAFDAAGEEYDLVTYIADGQDRGKFRHVSPGGQGRVIAKPNTYPELRCDKRPVIAKIHGAVSRDLAGRDSFVITENHYIAYLSHTEIPQLIPVNIAMRMRKSHFLFLGYSLRDWNLRVILHRIWGDEGLSFNSWAVQPHPDRIEERSWYKRGVELMDARLEEYMAAFGDALEEVAAEG